MTTVVLVRVYPGTGRPNQFEVLSETDTENIERLIEGYGYSVVDRNKPDDYSVSKAWDEYTINDADGFTQWRPAS